MQLAVYWSIKTENHVVNGRIHSKQLGEMRSRSHCTQQKHTFPDNTNTPVLASNYLGWLIYCKAS